MSRIILLMAVAAALTGCMTLDLHYDPPHGKELSKRSPVSINVTDQRPYILDGEKKPSFVGRFRADFGDPHAIYIKDMRPLADQLKQDMSKELRSLGYEPQDLLVSKSIAVTIHDWNTDGYGSKDADFWYEVSIAVISPDGNVLARSNIKEKRKLDSGCPEKEVACIFFPLKKCTCVRASGAIHRGMPIIYGEIIKALLRDNPEVMTAMRGDEAQIASSVPEVVAATITNEERVASSDDATTVKDKEKSEAIGNARAASQPVSDLSSGITEEYFAVFGGGAQFNGAQANVHKAPICFLGCTPAVDANQAFQLEKGKITGIRFGTWGEYFGFAVEWSQKSVESMRNDNGSTLSISYDSFSLIPMVRMPLYKSDSVPGGRINLYGGIGISQISGDVSVSIPPSVENMHSNNATGDETLSLIGVSLRLPKIILFVEWRKTDGSLSGSHYSSIFSNGSDTVSVPISTTEMIFGAAYRF